MGMPPTLLPLSWQLPLAQAVGAVLAPPPEKLATSFLLPLSHSLLYCPSLPLSYILSHALLLRKIYYTLAFRGPSFIGRFRYRTSIEPVVDI